MLVNSILSLAFVAFVFCTPETTSAEQIEKRADVNGLNKRDHLDLLAARLDGDETDKRSYYRPSYGYGNRYNKRDEVEKRSYYRPSYGYGGRYYKRDEVDKRSYYRPSYGYGNRYYKRDESDEADEARREDDIDLSKRFYYGFVPYKRSEDGNEMNKRNGYYRPNYGHYY